MQTARDKYHCELKECEEVMLQLPPDISANSPCQPPGNDPGYDRKLLSTVTCHTKQNESDS